MLHSDHNLPGPGNVLQRGKGVAVVLDPVMQAGVMQESHC